MTIRYEEMNKFDPVDKALPALTLLINQTVNSVMMLNNKYQFEISLKVTPQETYIKVNGVDIATDDWSI